MNDGDTHDNMGQQGLEKRVDQLEAALDTIAEALAQLLHGQKIESERFKAIMLQLQEINDNGKRAIQKNAEALGILHGQASRNWYDLARRIDGDDLKTFNQEPAEEIGDRSVNDLTDEQFGAMIEQVPLSQYRSERYADAAKAVGDLAAHLRTHGDSLGVLGKGSITDALKAGISEEAMKVHGHDPDAPAPDLGIAENQVADRVAASTPSNIDRLLSGRYSYLAVPDDAGAVRHIKEEGGIVVMLCDNGVYVSINGGQLKRAVTQETMLKRLLAELK